MHRDPRLAFLRDRFAQPQAETTAARRAEPDPFVVRPPIRPAPAQPPAHDRPEPSAYAAPPPTYPSGSGPAYGAPAHSPILTTEAAPSGASESEWRVEGDTGSMAPLSALQVLSTLNDKVTSGRGVAYQPVPLGFTPLDRTIGGGLRSGELLLIGGAQGTGKTTLSLQMARNAARSGQTNVLYICFEHDEEYLLYRLIALESALGTMPPGKNAVKIQEVRKEVVGSSANDRVDPAQLFANPRLRPSLEQIAHYGQSLFLLRGTQTASTVPNIRRLIEEHKALSGDKRLMVVVDYLQKVPVVPEPASEADKVTFVVNGLKDIALSLDVPIVSIVAADKEGLKAARLRSHHLRGSSAINYEADVILIVNEKYNIVSKVNLEYNPYHAQRFREWVIVTVEKNRGGQDNLDLEFRKHFEYSCFDPNGQPVQEKLVEERLYNE